MKNGPGSHFSTGSLFNVTPDLRTHESVTKATPRSTLSCNFRWANVGCAMQNHPHFAHPKNVGPTCCTNVGPTCCTNVGPTCWANVGPTCWANVGSLLESGSCLQCFFFLISFSQLFTCYSPCDLSVFFDRQSLKFNSDSRIHLNDYNINLTYTISGKSNTSTVLN